MSSSLFPDYAVLESGRNEAQAMRLAQQLRKVDLQCLATDADRHAVIARLRRQGIDNAMQLIMLTQEEVLGWYNVGPTFLSVLASIRSSVVARPEQLVDEWYNRHRLYVLPDDLESEVEAESDFFGQLYVAEPSVEVGRCERVAEGEAASFDDPQAASIRLLERCIVSAVEMTCRRSADGEMLRAFFLDGLPVEMIVERYGLPSATSLYRRVNLHFRQPLLRGYQTRAGVQFSTSILDTVRSLRKELLYHSAAVLDVLQRISSQRFLYFLGLTRLVQTQAERYWGGDFVVGEGEVEKCRRTVRQLLNFLQRRVVMTKENVIRRGVKGGKVPFLRQLLKNHPSIESDRRGYRLVASRLSYDCVRMARIVHDAHGPVSLAELLLTYERLYLERPATVSISHVRALFPQVHSVRRGVWEWR